MKWEPTVFIKQARGQGESAVSEAIGSPYVLLVKLSADAVDLGSGLVSTSPLIARKGAGEAGASPMAFQTQQGDLRSVLARVAEQREAKSRAAGFTLDGVPFDLLTEACFIVPLRKQAGSSGVMPDRITVGRTRNHDIMLRHSSVSKFHAWFEMAPSGALSLADAGSKNHTTINGDLVGEQPVPVHIGARLRFGSVDVALCSTGALWKVLSGA